MWHFRAGAARRLGSRWRATSDPHSDDRRLLIGALPRSGAQVVGRRVIAAVTASFGVNLLITLASPAGPHGRTGRILTLAAAAGGLLMAIGWLRRRWPARLTSVGFVLAGTALAAVTAVVPADPELGLLGVAAASAFLTGYTTSFHGARLLLVTWTVIASAVIATSLRVAAVDPLLAILDAVIIGAVNVAVALISRTAMRLLLHDDGHDGMLQLPDLLTSAGFRTRTATLLAEQHHGPERYLALAALDVDGYSLVTGMSGQQGGRRAQIAVGGALRASVHRGTLVAQRSEAEFLLADVLTTPDATSLVEGVRTAVACSALPLTLSAGVVCTPLSPLRGCSSGDVVDEIVTLATTAMAEARRAGGDTVRYQLDPRLAAVGGFDHDPR